MEVVRLLSGPLGVNTYIARKGAAKDCFIVDPADESQALEHLDKHGLKCTHILLTHGHFDHILGVARLQKELGAKVAIHKQDADGLWDSRINLSNMAGICVAPCRADILLEDGDRLTAAGLTVDVIATPGHTKGGVCFVINDERVMFSGDTLFLQSVGRCDLPGSSSEALYESIQYRLFALSGDYQVYPGHMGRTTLEYERKNNPYMKQWNMNKW